MNLDTFCDTVPLRFGYGMTDLFLELKLDDTSIHTGIKHLILNEHLYFTTNKLLLERH